MMPSPTIPTFPFAMTSLRWHSSRGRYTAPSTAFKRDVAIGCAEGYLAHG
jgi:hypothetical protein